MVNPDEFDEVEDTAPHDRAKDKRRRYVDQRDIEHGLNAKPGEIWSGNKRVGEWDPEKLE